MKKIFAKSATESGAATGAGTGRPPFKARFYSGLHLLVANAKEFHKDTGGSLFHPPRKSTPKDYERIISAYKKSFGYVPTLGKAFSVTDNMRRLADMLKNRHIDGAAEKAYTDLCLFCTDAVGKLSSEEPHDIAFLHIFRGIANYRLAGYEQMRGATENEKRLYGLAIDDCTLSIESSPDHKMYAHLFRALAYAALGDIAKKEGNDDAATANWLNAKEDYTAAIRMLPKSGLFNYRSDVLRKLGDENGCKEDLGMAATIRKQEDVEECVLNGSFWNLGII